MARDDLHFRLRIPEDLKDRIHEAALANKRSMTAEIIDRLQTSFDGRDFDDRVAEIAHRAVQEVVQHVRFFKDGEDVTSSISRVLVPYPPGTFVEYEPSEDQGAEPPKPLSGPRRRKVKMDRKA